MNVVSLYAYEPKTAVTGPDLWWCCTLASRLLTLEWNRQFQRRHQYGSWRNWQCTQCCTYSSCTNRIDHIRNYHTRTSYRQTQHDNMHMYVYFIFAKIAQPKTDKPIKWISQITLSMILVLFDFVPLGEPEDVSVVLLFKLRKIPIECYARHKCVNIKQKQKFFAYHISSSCICGGSLQYGSVFFCVPMCAQLRFLLILLFTLICSCSFVFTNHIVDK